MPSRAVSVRSGAEEEVRLPSAWLAEMGLVDGGRATAQVSPGRLVLTVRRDVREIQSELGEIAGELEGLRDRLAEMSQELPEPPETMLRAEVPADVEADVLGSIECIVADDLDPAIRKLRAAAAVTAEQLREHWEGDRPGRS